MRRREPSSATSKTAMTSFPIDELEAPSSSQQQHFDIARVDSNDSSEQLLASDASEEDTSLRAFHDMLEQWQRRSALLAHILAVLSLAMVYLWIAQLGGLSWQKGQAKLVFNWHPVLMITTFCFMTVATFAFRYPSAYILSNRAHSKLLHWLSWTTAGLSAFVGLIAVFRSHNDSQSGYIANMYSFHSWMGAAVVVFYVGQFLMGMYAFVLPSCSTSRRVSESFKAKVLAVHYYLGPLIYFATVATILLGIEEKEGFVGCSYPVTSGPDVWPVQNFFEIPLACRISHGLGLLVASMAICTAFSLFEFAGPRRR